MSDTQSHILARISCKISSGGSFPMKSKMKRGTEEYRAFHRAEMSEWRARKQGPRITRCVAQTIWRGHEVQTAKCAYCGGAFQRTKQPRLKTYCTTICRSRAKNARENPDYAYTHQNDIKLKTVRETRNPSSQKCTGCQWRKGLQCWNPGLPTHLHPDGSVSIRKSGKCPLTS